VKKLPEAEQRERLRALSEEPDRAELPPADRALLDYALRVTREPWSVRREHVDALRGHGFGDRAIHDACSIVAYYAFVNRIADGLGVEIEAVPPEAAGGE